MTFGSKMTMITASNLFPIIHPMYRDCPPGDECEVHPCCHTPCHDPDWLMDREEMRKNVSFYSETWRSFMLPSYRDTLSAEDRAKHEIKYDLYQRLTDKQDAISAELQDFKRRRWERHLRLIEENRRNKVAVASGSGIGEGDG
jgi:hypothetical protein